MEYPSTLELLEFFELEAELDDDVRFYVIKDAFGNELTFSYNPFEDWVKTHLQHSGGSVISVCNEGLTGMRIDQCELRAEFTRADFHTVLTVKLEPSIHVEWNGLIVYR